MKRFISAVLTATFCLGAISGCAQKETPTTTPVVMTIDGENIHANELAMYMAMTKSSYKYTYTQLLGDDFNEEEFWADEGVQNNLKEYAKEQLLYNHALYKLADELDIKLTRDQKADVKSYKDYLIQSTGSKEEFLKYIAATGMSESDFDRYAETDYYLDNLTDYYFGEKGKEAPPREDIVKYYNDNYYRVKQVLIKTVDDSMQPLDEKTVAEKTKLANDILERAKNGESFDALIKEYNEDPGMQSNPNGYTFSANDGFDEAFLNAAKEAEINGFGMAEGMYGFYIIQRLELDETTLFAKDGSVQDACIRDDIVSYMLDGAGIDSKLSPVVEALKVEETDEYAKVTLSNLDDYLNK